MDSAFNRQSIGLFDHLVGVGTVAANISELFGPLEKPPLAALPFFLGC
jgi:hypothetical protein